MLHIKLMETEHGVPCKHIVCPYTHTQPVGQVKNKTNLNVVMLQIIL